MEEPRILVQVFKLLVLLSVLSVFTAIETVLLRINKNNIKEIKDDNVKTKEKNRDNGIIAMWNKNSSELIASLLLFKVFFNIIFIININNLYLKITGNYSSIVKNSIFFGIVLIILIFIELVPRIAVKNKENKILKISINFLNSIRIVLKPLIFLVLKISKIIVKLCGKETVNRITEITEEDIKSFVKEGTETGIIEEEEEEMIHSIFEFSDTTVKEVLTPRTQVFAIEKEETLGNIWNEIVEQGFSRIPIYNETIDKIIGIVHLKDIIKYDIEKNSDLKIKELKKEAYFVPVAKPLMELLEEFKRKQIHMAIVVDEYGGTEGIVTIEDLLEEIVGDIRDEFDQEEKQSIQQIREKIFDIRGDTLIEEINEELSINIPLSEEYETVSGYIQDKLGKVAEVSEQVKGDNFILKVMEVDNKRIEKIRVIITGEYTEEKPNDRNN